LIPPPPCYSITRTYSHLLPQVVLVISDDTGPADFADERGGGGGGISPVAFERPFTCGVPLRVNLPCVAASAAAGEEVVDNSAGDICFAKYVSRRTGIRGDGWPSRRERSSIARQRDHTCKGSSQVTGPYPPSAVIARRSPDRRRGSAQSVINSSRRIVWKKRKLLLFTVSDLTVDVVADRVRQSWPFSQNTRMLSQRLAFGALVRRPVDNRLSHDVVP